MKCWKVAEMVCAMARKTFAKTTGSRVLAAMGELFNEV